MRCAMVRGLFSELYDGVADSQAALEQHIKDCPACAAEFDSFCRFFNGLKKISEPDIPPGFHEMLMQNIHDSFPPNDTTVDNMMDIIETRQMMQEVKRNRLKSDKPRKVLSPTTTRRWASIAAAACVLFFGMWAVRTIGPTGGLMLNNETGPMYDAEPQIAPATDAIPRDYWAWTGEADGEEEYGANNWGGGEWPEYSHAEAHIGGQEREEDSGDFDFNARRAYNGDDDIIVAAPMQAVNDMQDFEQYDEYGYPQHELAFDALVDDLYPGYPDAAPTDDIPSFRLGGRGALTYDDDAEPMAITQNLYMDTTFAQLQGQASPVWPTVVGILAAISAVIAITMFALHIKAIRKG